MRLLSTTLLGFCVEICNELFYFHIKLLLYAVKWKNLFIQSFEVMTVCKCQSRQIQNLCQPYTVLYRVIHKSVKHFKNLQQINCSTDPGSSYADRETLQVFYTFPLPANLQDLRDHITIAVALVDCDMLTRAWNEMDCHIDVCRITKGGHIQHL